MGAGIKKDTRDFLLAETFSFFQSAFKTLTVNSCPTERTVSISSTRLLEISEILSPNLYCLSNLLPIFLAKVIVLLGLILNSQL